MPRASRPPGAVRPGTERLETDFAPADLAVQLVVERLDLGPDRGWSIAQEGMQRNRVTARLVVNEGYFYPTAEEQNRLALCPGSSKVRQAGERIGPARMARLVLRDDWPDQSAIDVNRDGRMLEQPPELIALHLGELLDHARRCAARPSGAERRRAASGRPKTGLWRLPAFEAICWCAGNGEPDPRRQLIDHLEDFADREAGGAPQRSDPGGRIRRPVLACVVACPAG